ncbi:hypothetical protein O6H91_05G047500 [Diphasiastrum complanatum]|uniref:Uncharacterized protein n=1 Tax=Diphasiastrum complanatum TaxID=34168 RepID=A0ACC2DNS7_DIPCM|nr:hypothetical protein O6H91_05G047500 [Diphasiastrum complanatum]
MLGFHKGGVIVILFLFKAVSKEVIVNRASQWDVSVQEYIKDANFYLSHQQPGSIYSFTSVGESQMRLSWTMEKNGTKLEGRWRLEKENNEAQVTREILDFLMDSNIKLSEEVVRKTYAFEKMKSEAEKCLAQNQRFVTEKIRFEEDIYKKFVAVLNTKKAKLRELRDALAQNAPTIKKEQEDEDDLGDDTDNDDEMDEAGEERDSRRPTYKPHGELDRKTAIVRGKDLLKEHSYAEFMKENHDQHSSKEVICQKDGVDPDATQPFEDLVSTSRPNNDIGTSRVTVKTEALDELAADILRASTHASAPRKRRLV